MKKILLGSLLACSLQFTHAQSGILDPTFGVKGIAKTDMGSTFSYNRSSHQVLTQANGSIFLVLNGTFPGSVVSKRHSNGSIDSTYGVNGYSSPVPATEAFGALQADGKVVITGTAANNTFVVARLLANGTPDLTFGVKGVQITEFAGPSFARSVAIQSDGKIVVTGYTTTDDINTYFAVVRYNTNGSIDNSFNGNGIATTDFMYKVVPDTDGADSTVFHNAYAYSVAIQADGKIVVGGYVNTGLSYDFALARYNANGTPDNTFDGDGKQTTDFGSNEEAYSLALQADGKIVLGGYTAADNTNQFAVARYNSNGQPDISFNGTGTQTAPVGSDIQIGNSLALQANGKIVLAGYTLNGDFNDFAVTRFNADGSTDNSFNGGAVLTTDFATSDDYAGSLAVQADGKILAAGYSYIYSANTVQQIAVARYNTDGTPDNSFGDNGQLKSDNQQGSTYFNSTAIQSNRKVVAAGRTWNGTSFDFAIVRYNVNGSIDSTFSNDGKQTTDFGGADEAVSAAIQPDGKILVAGNSDNQFAIARYNADGSPDNSFSGDGKLLMAVGNSDNFKSLALQTDGKIIMAGSTFTDLNNDSSYFAVVRLNSNGTPDNTFNGNGKLLTDFESSPSFGYAAGVQTNGKIVVAGRSYINNQNYFAIARYNADGSLDNSFSDDGKQISIFGQDDYNIQALAIQNDSKIVVAGYSEALGGSSTSFVAARYLTNGDIDNSFGDNGLASTNLGPGFNFGKSVAISSNGRIAVGGTNGDYALVLFKADGSLDSSFGTNGIVITEVGLGTSSIQSIFFSEDKLYAAGSGQFPGTFGVVARYLLTAGGPLPVSLVDLKATLQNKSTLLQWQTASEENLAGFEVERSNNNGNDFSYIGYVTAKGNSNSKLDYSIIDQHPLAGVNFYRLKMIDIDGKFTYSKIVSVNLSEAIFTFKVFPNPVQDILFVKTQSENANASLRIVDASGRTIRQVNVILNGNNTFPVRVNDLPRGVYQIQLNTKTTAETKQFIKE